VYYFPEIFDCSSTKAFTNPSRPLIAIIAAPATFLKSQGWYGANAFVYAFEAIEETESLRLELTS